MNVPETYQSVPLQAYQIHALSQLVIIEFCSLYSPCENLYGKDRFLCQYQTLYNVFY